MLSYILTLPILYKKYPFRQELLQHISRSLMVYQKIRHLKSGNQRRTLQGHLCSDIVVIRILYNLKYFRSHGASLFFASLVITNLHL